MSNQTIVAIITIREFLIIPFELLYWQYNKVNGQGKTITQTESRDPKGVINGEFDFRPQDKSQFFLMLSNILISLCLNQSCI